LIHLNNSHSLTNQTNVTRKNVRPNAKTKHDQVGKRVTATNIQYQKEEQDKTIDDTKTAHNPTIAKMDSGCITRTQGLGI